MLHYNFIYKMFNRRGENILTLINTFIEVICTQGAAQHSLEAGVVLT